MDVTDPGIVMDFNAEQFSKRLMFILLRDSGRLIDSNALQYLNAYRPMFKTDSGMLICFRFSQPSKALSSIVVTPYGTSMLFNPILCAKDPAPIILTLPGITVFGQPSTSVPVFLLMTALQSSLLSKCGLEGFTFMLLSSGQSSNALFSI